MFGSGQSGQDKKMIPKASIKPTKDNSTLPIDTAKPFLLAGDFDLFYTGSNRKNPVNIHIDSIGNITQSKVYGRMWLDGEPPCQAVLYKRLDSARCDTFMLSTNMDFYYTLKMKHGNKSFDLVPKSVQP